MGTNPDTQPEKLSALPLEDVQKLVGASLSQVVEIVDINGETVKGINTGFLSYQGILVANSVVIDVEKGERQTTRSIPARKIHNILGQDGVDIVLPEAA